MIINSAKYSCAAGHEINEDSCLCSSEKGIFIVADGLGGHSDGEKASLAAVDYFEENYRGGCSSELISQLMEGANTEVMQKGDGGKTTVAAAFAENGYFHYANAGDSRVYYFRDGRIIAQTKDHSVCQASVDMGMISPEDIRGNEDRSRLLKVLGSEEKLNIKKSYPPIKMQDGDAFLLCSDGFWEYVYETEMEADLLKSDNSEAWIKYMLKRHILRAENKGDNYTAVCGMIHLDGSESFALPAERTGQDVPEKSGRRKFVPIMIAGTVLIAAAIISSVLLINGSTDDDDLQITETSTVSETDEVTQTETVKETDEIEENTDAVTTKADSEEENTDVTTTKADSEEENADDEADKADSEEENADDEADEADSEEENTDDEADKADSEEVNTDDEADKADSEEENAGDAASKVVPADDTIPKIEEKTVVEMDDDTVKENEAPAEANIPKPEDDEKAVGGD